MNRVQKAIRLLIGARRYDAHHDKAQVAKDQRAINAAKAAGAQVAPKPKPRTVPRGIMPGAIVRLLPTVGQEKIIPWGVIWHIAVTEALDLFGLFSNDGGIESHFYVLRDGTIIQYRNIFLKADAQFDGNAFSTPKGLAGFISVEQQGGVGPDILKGSTPEQVAAFKKIVRFVNSESPFAQRVCPAWNAQGVGYHALFHEWNLSNHSCPGVGRITQFHDVIAPWLTTQRSKP